ncbi:MAG TPA: hypothetical protein VGE36_21840, partial [Roseateles sp.]
MPALLRRPTLLLAALLLAGCGSPARDTASPQWLAAWGSAQLDQQPAAPGSTPPPAPWQAPLN